MTRRKVDFLGVVAHFETSQGYSYYDSIIPEGYHPAGSFTSEVIVSVEDFKNKFNLDFGWMDDDKSRFFMEVKSPILYHTPRTGEAGKTEDDGTRLYSFTSRDDNITLDAGLWSNEKYFPGCEHPLIQYAERAEFRNPPISEDEEPQNNAYVTFWFDQGCRYPSSVEFLKRSCQYDGDFIWNTPEFGDNTFITNNVRPSAQHKFSKWNIRSQHPLAESNQKIIDALNIKDKNGLRFTTHRTFYDGHGNNGTRLFFWADENSAKYKRDGLIKCDGVGRIIFDPKTNIPIWY